MNTLKIVNARILTPESPGPRRGPQMAALRIIPRGSIVFAEGRIAAVGPEADALHAAREIDANGRVILPAFVDCHTHACWAGSRLDEWEMKSRGVPYLEILKGGGGIMSTVRAVRAAAESDLALGVLARLKAFFAGGTTTVEIKSGYGLDTATELKMLRAISTAAQQWQGEVVPTALLGHAIDPAMSREEFVRTTIDVTLPAVSAAYPGIPVDAFCEDGAWSLDEVRELFERAAALGHPLRVHSDQFTSRGMTPAAASMNARSVDHLEASTAADIEAIVRAGCIGVALPICGLHLDRRFASLRPLIDSGGAAAIATNCNPGSAPSTSMLLAMQLAVRHCGLRVHEAITAATANGAAVLGLKNCGVLATGMRGDAVMLRVRDEREAVYELGADMIADVVCKGELADTATA